MNLVEWKPEYNIGEPDVDKEHQLLFKIAREALHIDLPSKKKEKIQEIIGTLLRYTKTHFKHEEAYMQKVSYPKLEEHKEEHELILKELLEFVSHLNDLSIEEVEKALADFIQINIVHHIVIEDKKISFWTSKTEDIISQVGWKEFYYLGEPLIDNEHKQLFVVAKKALEAKDSILNIKACLKDLYEYMHKHFENEEKFMEKISYPEIEHHKLIHHKVLEDLDKFVQELSKDRLKNYKKKLALFIEIWLVNHIVHEDKKIVTWKAKNKGA